MRDLNLFSFSNGWEGDWGQDINIALCSLSEANEEIINISDIEIANKFFIR